MTLSIQSQNLRCKIILLQNNIYILANSNWIFGQYIETYWAVWIATFLK